MRVIKTVSTASVVLALVGSAAIAQDAKTGMITQIDRLNGTIAIQQTQDGTVGAGSSGGSVRQYKVQGASLDAVHAGDQVSFTATRAGGVDTITKLEKKKR